MTDFGWSNLRIFHMLELYHFLAILRFFTLVGDGEFTLTPSWKAKSSKSKWPPGGMKFGHCEWPGSYFLQDSQIHTYSCIRIVNSIFLASMHLFLANFKLQKHMFATQRAMKKSSLGLWPYNTNRTFLQNFEKIWSARSWLRFFVGNTFASTLSKQPVTITLTRFLSWQKNQKTSPKKLFQPRTFLRAAAL